METKNKGLPDPEFVKDLPIAQTLGLRFNDRLPGRRGGALRYKGEEGFYIIKAVDESVPSDFPSHLEPRAITIGREARVLRLLGKTSGDMYIADGKQGSVVWLLTREIEAPAAMRVCDEIRESSGSSEHTLTQLVGVFASLARKVADIHDAGFLHGDLQPPHFLVHPTSGVYVIDFEFARQIEDKETRYAGALVHYNSPEVARGMLSHDENIPYDELSEVYSLGATLFTLYTRQPLPDYETKAHKELPLEQKLQSIIEGKQSTFTSTDSYPCPELESTIQWATSTNRETRCPSAQRLADRLEEIAQQPPM